MVLRRIPPRNLVRGAVGLILALLVWQLAALSAGSAAVPSPGDVWENVAGNIFSSVYLEQHRFPAGGYLPHIAFTVENVLAGVVVGCVIGISLGLGSVLLPAIGEVVTPVAGTFGTAPIIVAAPFFLIWFGIVSSAQILLVTFYTALLLYIYSRRAADNVPPEYVESALVLGASRWHVFRSVYAPGTVPEIMAGLRIALAGAWGLETVTELLGAQSGVGVLVLFYRGGFSVVGMLGLTLALGVVAIMVDRLLVLIGAYVTRWSEAGHQLAL